MLEFTVPIALVVNSSELENVTLSAESVKYDDGAVTVMLLVRLSPDTVSGLADGLFVMTFPKLSDNGDASWNSGCMGIAVATSVTTWVADPLMLVMAPGYDPTSVGVNRT